ncbi:TonB-dependent receptor [Quatrionicoccus australiensis]|nr:TonB-dependent receptor [Quatrionicoccus australiensis]UCV14988.1 TonB-dependent receptor [Quatrionicoccus australiensis]
MNSRLKPLAVLLPALFAIPAAAQQLALLDDVVVTASRFSDSSLATASNVTTITREDIRDSGAQTLPDVLRYNAGLQVTPLYGSIGADTSIDMRGFGEGAAQRTLVLLNGLRLNPLDTSNVDWGLIPLDSVERIEIVSGSAAILYGDNAVGGVINIITGKQRDGASIQAGLGSDNGRQLSASIARQVDKFDLALAVNHQATDGWRKNNKQERNNLSGRLGMRFDRGEAFVDIGWSALDIGLPGSLSKAQYENDPRQAATNDSYAERRTAFVRPGITWRLADSLSFAAELGYTEVDNTSWISDWGSFDRRKTNTVSFTPRLQWDHGLAGLNSKTTFGFDYYDGELTSDKSAGDHAPITKTVTISQTSQAVYLQNQTRLTSDLTLTAGSRYQQVEQSARDTTGKSISNDHSRGVGEVGLSYKLAPGFRLFTRAGTTFRFANLDELTVLGPAGFASNPVRPERGTFVDLGGQWTGNGYSLKVTAYSLNMTDEIAYNGTENVNMAKTRHQGVDTFASYEISPHWQINAGLNLQKAEFRDGSNAGNRIPLVPTNKSTAGLTFKPTTDVNLSLFATHVGARHFGSDTGNAGEKIAAYTTADFVATWHIANWTVRGRVANLTDKKYVSTGFYGGIWGNTYYPGEGRAVFADVRYSF